MSRYDPTRDPLFLAYYDLWMRYRALLAATAAATGRPVEMLETDVRQWIEDHRRPETFREAAQDFVQYVAGVRDRPGEGDEEDPPPGRR